MSAGGEISKEWSPRIGAQGADPSAWKEIACNPVWVADAAYFPERYGRTVIPAGSVARYETRTGDNHHHAVCRSCGAITDVDCAVGHVPCLTASDPHGFVIDEAEVLYWGLCPDCSTARS